MEIVVEGRHMGDFGRRGNFHYFRSTDGGSRRPQIPLAEPRHSRTQTTLCADEKAETGGMAGTVDGIDSADSIGGGEVARELENG